MTAAGSLYPHRDRGPDRFMDALDEALAEIDGAAERSGILALQEQGLALYPKQPQTLAVRWLRAHILRHLGRYDEALAEIDGTAERPGILALEEQSPGLIPKHPQTLNTCSLRAAILNDLGYHQASEGGPRAVSTEQRAARGLADDSG